jgi:hypothetical protein
MLICGKKILFMLILSSALQKKIQKTTVKNTRKKGGEIRKKKGVKKRCQNGENTLVFFISVLQNLLRQKNSS